MYCTLCGKPIETGHFYLDYIPKGYSPENRLTEAPGVMHKIHLSSTDFYRHRGKKLA